MDLSICIPVFNEVELTFTCLKSIPEASRGLQVQVILIDNGSTDGTFDRVSSSFPDVDIIRNDRNRGFSVAVNQGLGKALAEKILVLNNDARLLPESLKPFTIYMDQNDSVGIVGPCLMKENGRRQNSISNFPSLTEVFVGKWILRLLFPNRYPGKRSVGRDPVEVESVIGAAMLIRRSLLYQIGLFDERFFFFLEETDLCRRAVESGWKVVFLPEIEVIHLSGGSVRKYDKLKSIEYIRSLFLYFHKSQRGRYFALRLAYPVKICGEVVVFGMAVVLSLGLLSRLVVKFQRKWASLVWILRGCPESVGLDEIK